MRTPRICNIKALPACFTLFTVLMVLNSSKLVRPAPETQRQRAVCTLQIQGTFIREILESLVVSAALDCESTSPVSIWVNTTHLGKHISQFTGVQVISDLACQQQAQGWWTSSGGTRKSLLAMLYFCGDYDIVLLQPRVLNMTLTYNSSDWDSAVLAFGGSTVVTVRQGSFVGNSASSTIVAFQKAKLTIQDNTFVDHNQGMLGAGITAIDAANLVLRDATFSNNTARLGGGGVSCHHNATVSIGSCLFDNNSASNFGGALYIACQQAAISNVTCQGNRADFGGSVYADRNTTTSLESSSFTANLASTSGGGIFVNTSSAVTATGCTFSANNASYGGGLHCDGCMLQAHSLSFTNNNAVKNGGGLYAMNQAQIDVTSSTWHGNTADTGAGIACSNVGAKSPSSHATLNISESTFSNNTAKGHGGACSCEGFVKVELADSNLSSCTADTGGAFGLQDQVTLHVSGSSFWNNTADRFGGAVVAGGQSKTSVMVSTFAGNHAGRDGAALYMTESAQVFVGHNSIFVNNSASRGAIAIRNVANLSLSNSSLMNNSANGSGGALILFDTSVALVTAGSIISGNHAATDSGGGGGGVYAADNSLLTINEDTKVQDNSADFGGGVYASYSAQVRMERSAVSGNQVTTSGGGLYFDTNARGNLTGCNVTSNVAGSIGFTNSISGGMAGGGLGSSGQTVLTLQDCLVVNNRAVGNGGGILLQDTAQLIMLGDTSVTSNHADFGWGGGVSLFSGGFDLGQITRAVLNNSGQYDVDVQSNVTHLTIVGNTSIYDFANRIGTDKGLLHVLLNISGYYGLPCQAVQAQAGWPDGTFLGSNVSDKNGLVHLGFEVARPPGVYVISLSSPDAPGVPAANLTLQIRSCIRGEVTPSPVACQPCQQGFFSFDPSQEVCSVCPGNANEAYCGGGDVITPLHGYWRSSVDSVQIHRCPNPTACNPQAVGNSALLACTVDRKCGTSTTYQDLQCAPGYYGNLCGLCLPGTGATRLFVCRECMRSGSTVALYVLAAVVLLGLIKLLCHLHRKQDAVASHSDEQESKVPAAQLLRPLLLYSQYMLVVSSMPVEWPASIGYPLKVLAWLWAPASPETLSIDCLLPRGTHLPISVQKVLFYVCTPLVILALLLLVEMAHGRYLRVQKKHVAMQVKGVLHSSAVVAVFFFYPSILRNLFSMFACIPIDQPAAAPYTPAAVGSYWVMDTNQQCFTGYHKVWSLGFGLPCILLVCLGLPLGVLVLMLTKKAHLAEPTTRQHYGFLYMSYRRPMFCWECVVMSQTTVLVAISVFAANLGVIHQVIVMNAALILMEILLLIFKPYAYHQAGKVMLQAVFCLLLTSYTALTFLPWGIIQPSLKYGMIMGCVVLLVNLVYVVSVIWQIARLVNWRQVWIRLRRIGAEQITGPASQVQP